MQVGAKKRTTIFAAFAAMAAECGPMDYKGLVTREVAPAAVSTNGAGRLLVDFGRDAVGWLELRGDAEGPYEIIVGELVDGRGEVTNAHPGATIRTIRVSGVKGAGTHRVPLPPDRLNLRGYDLKAPAILLPERFGIVAPFRYADVASAPQGVSFAQVAVNYPIDMAKGAFECDDANLNRVYEFCKYTMLATSYCGLYVDGDRERTPYEADAYINQLGHYAIDDDRAMARRTHEWLMDHPTWPTEWRQHSIKMAWADWMWSGDKSSLERNYGRLVGEKLMDRYARASDGLLETGGERNGPTTKPGAADIVDWPKGERDGFVFTPVNAVVNAFYCKNLLELADIASALGKDGDAAAFRARAEAVRGAFVAAFFDAEAGLFRDGEGTDHHSLHANAAALAFHLAPDEAVPGILAFLEKKGMACSVYFAQYLLEAFCENGRADAAVRLMAADGDRSWIGMLDFGSTITMEAWSVAAKKNTDLNHAWGAAPLNVIARYVAGVTPLEPGFAKVAIRPQLGGLGRVEATVPTPLGPVKVKATPDALELDSPAPVEATFGGRTRLFPAGKGRM